MSEIPRQSASEAPGVPARARQGAKAHGRDWTWVEATVWSERMVAALENGVKGGKWFSLIDKLYRSQTLRWPGTKSGATPEPQEWMGRALSGLRCEQKRIWKNLSERLGPESIDQSRSSA